MKKKTSILLKSILLLGLPITFLSSCGTNEIDGELHTISFYDESTLVEKIETKGYETIDLPSAQNKENYDFKGWFLDKNIWSEELTRDYFLNKPLLEDLDCYAFYEKKSEPVVEKYTISFYVDNKIFSTIETSGNEILTLPNAPQKENYSFKGWYFDNESFEDELTADFYENIALKSDVNVYAYYELVNEEPKEFKVSFDSNGGSKVEDVVTSIIESEPDTTRDGYTFLGWYLEESFINKVTFPFEVTKDQTLYAKWEENIPASISFNVNEEGVLTSVEGISEINNEVVIPSRVNDIDVREIGDKVFADNLFIKKLVIPESVKSLGNKMCYGAKNLEEVVLPNNITVIPDYAFENCSSLTNINIPTSLVQIRANAFSQTALKEFIAPESLKEIWLYAFKDAKELRNVELKNVTEIGNMVFENCEKLESIVIPETLEEIGTSVFGGCSSLQDIDLPNKPLALDHNTFYGSAYYEDNSNWENGVLYVDNYLLTINSDFLNLSEYEVKEGTIAIAINAFLNNAKNLTKITLPEGLKLIGDKAFSSLYKLESVNIPSSVDTIGYNAFASTGISSNSTNWSDNGLYIDGWLVNVQNTKISEFEVKEGTIGVSNGSDVSFIPSRARKITKLTLPASLRYIGKNSFKQLTLIKEISLGGSLEFIKEGAFAVCSSLEKVNLDECTNLALIGDQAFSQAKISEITIPESVLEMGELVFNQNRANLIVHCMVSEKPASWDSNWDFTYNEQYKITVEWKK
ncbi:MAG: leucine-rich repeat protein [Firmicutes bacterium]|uniref:Leucine-rich repeat protein n=1 Tax=Candidatus Onthovivens merdipullorum TaxID=2840889 RepID=A0A9D9DGN9_9BACL|nr:leucine-rich repeat protein [Candidatus Onthovivens merdipullorum]